MYMHIFTRQNQHKEGGGSGGSGGEDGGGDDDGGKKGGEMRKKKDGHENNGCYGSPDWWLVNTRGSKGMRRETRALRERKKMYMVMYKYDTAANVYGNI
jgi:hypothetical protein